MWNRKWASQKEGVSKTILHIISGSGRYNNTVLSNRDEQTNDVQIPQGAKKCSQKRSKIPTKKLLCTTSTERGLT